MTSPATEPAAAAVYARELVRPTWGRRLKWRAETWAYAAIEASLGALPLPWVARAGRALGGAAGAVLAKRRKAVARNLRIAFAGERSVAELEGMTREVFRRAGANLLSCLRTARMGESALSRAVTVRDEVVYREALARGKGVVMVLAHMGNWEALAQWFPRLLPPGVAGATVYRPLNNPLMNARVSAARARLGVRLFSKDENPLGMAGFLRRGGVLGVLADQRAGVSGELVPFFGRLASCTPIPAILARRTGAAVVGVSLRTVGPGRWEMGFHAVEAGEPTTGAVMRLLERMMRESPEDVFWLQDRWRNHSSVPHLVAGKRARGENAVAAKRRRALLWAAEGGAPTPPAPAPDDVDYEVLGAGEVGGAARWTLAAGETPARALARIDAAEALPLDYVVGGDETVRAACRALGISWVKGED